MRETIAFQLPTATSDSGSPFRYVRGYATLVGTSVNICCQILACLRFDGGAGYLNTPPVIN